MRSINFIVGIFCLCLLGDLPLLAQNNVTVINEAGYLSETAIGSASTRLANELPNHDVRISYVTSFVDIPDRYKIYDSLGLMPFTAIPNVDGGFPEASQADKEAAINAGIGVALNNGGNANTIHIIYATAVSLTMEAEEDVISKKYLHFGPSVDRIDRMKVEQIVPNPELEVLSSTAQNDQYLADYVDELINALNDPNYVINGSVKYQNEIYFDGDTIYYFHGPDEIIQSQLAELQSLELLINPQYPVDPINWNETVPIPGAGAIIESNAPSTVANLRLTAAHFAGISELRASYGSQTTKVWFFPANLQLELSDYSIVETHTTSAIDAIITNNGLPWNSHPGLNIHLSLAKPSNNDMFIFESFDFPAGTPPDYSWEWPQEVCRKLRFIVSLHRPIPGTMSTRIREISIKCPFEIDGLLVDHISSNEDTTRLLEMEDGETLYIVRQNNDNTRLIKFDVITARPLSDFWENHTFVDGLAKQQPYWYSSAHEYGIQRMSPTPFIFEDKFPYSQGYNPLTYNDWLQRDWPTAEYNMEVSVFHDVYNIPLVFMNENRYNFGLSTSALSNFLNGNFARDFKFLLEVLEIVTGDGDGDDPIPPEESDFEFTISGERTLFLKEDKTTPGYIENKEDAIGFSLDWAKDLEIKPPVFPCGPPFCVTIPVLGGYYPFFSFSFGGFAALEWGYDRPMLSDDWGDHQLTFESGLALEVGGGIRFEILPDVEIVEIQAEAALTYPVEGKFKVLNINNSCADPDPPKFVYEFNRGPGAISFSAEVSYTIPLTGTEVSLFSVDTSMPLGDKVFMAGENNEGPNFLCNDE